MLIFIRGKTCSVWSNLGSHIAGMISGHWHELKDEGTPWDFKEKIPHVKE